MRVKDCRKCQHCQRRTWTSYHMPRGYHAIGMTHAYAYCTLYKKRVRDVKSCNGRSGYLNANIAYKA